MNIDSDIAPAFIVSSPRSGSTWLRLMLNDHPEIASGEETFLFTEWGGFQNMVSAYQRERGYIGLSTYLEEEEFYGLIRAFAVGVFRKFLNRQSKSKIVEKSARHALFIPSICRVFPNARFVHLVRDGRDCAISVVAAASKWNPDWPRSIAGASRLWRRHNESILENRDVIRDGRYLQLTYEELLSNGHASLTRVLEFLDAECGDKLVAKLLEQHTFEVYKRDRDWLNGNFFRKGISGQWKEHFSDDDKGRFKSTAGQLLIALGYEPDANW